MGSYGLPALDIKTPQQPDLLEKFSQLSQLRGQQQQQQMAQQEAPLRMQALQQNVQQGGLDIQQKQQALKDQQAVTSAMQKWDGKDLNDLAPLVLRNGGSATAVMGLKQHALEQKAKISAIAKDDAETGKNQIETQQKKNDALSGALGSLLQVPDEQLPQAIGATAQQLMQQGVLDPQHGQAAQQLAQLPPAQARQQLDIMRKGVTSNSQLLEQTKAEQTAANEKAMREQAAANAKNTQQHQIIDERQGQQRINIEGARLAFDKARQGTQDSQAVEAAAQQVSKYELPIPSMSRNTPFNRAVYARALEINPSLSSEGYATNQDYLSSKGKANANVQSFNKVAEHLHDVREASDAAGFNPIGVSGASHALATAQQVFGTEDVKYLAGTGVASEGELNKLHENINSSIPSIRAAALNQLETMTASAGRQIGANYERGTKQKFDPAKFFNNQAQGILQRHGEPTTGGAQGGKINVTAPDGSVHPFDNQQQADAFTALIKNRAGK